MNIQWFPGHMTKALRELSTIIGKVDAVLYVLDARAPFSCLNPEIGEIVKNKPIIYVLNKADMADRILTEKWLKFFQSKSGFAISTNSTRSTEKKTIVQAIKTALSAKIAKQREKGFSISLRVCVVGVPNTGKSTLINTLASSSLAKTGNIPGVTRSAEWKKIENGMEMLDNAGTLWPKFENKEIAKNLAFIGSISDNVVDNVEVAFALVEKLVEIAPTMLENRYDLHGVFGKETLAIFEEICKNRGFVLKKGEFDYERCAKSIIDDFRKCRIGRITLDRI